MALKGDPLPETGHTFYFTRTVWELPYYHGYRFSTVAKAMILTIFTAPVDFVLLVPAVAADVAGGRC